MSKKLLLTMSDDGAVIIIDVPEKHRKNKKEHFVSEGFLKANLSKFKDCSKSAGWDGRLFVLASDL